MKMMLDQQIEWKKTKLQHDEKQKENHVIIIQANFFFLFLSSIFPQFFCFFLVKKISRKNKRKEKFKRTSE